LVSLRELLDNVVNLGDLARFHDVRHNAKGLAKLIRGKVSDVAAVEADLSPRAAPRRA
jgi:hypothetical protein